MDRKIILLSLVTFLTSSGYAEVVLDKKEINSLVKKAKKEGIINEKIILGEDSTIENRDIYSEEQIVPGELTKESIEAERKDYERFEKSKKNINKKDIDLEKNKETREKINKEIGKVDLSVFKDSLNKANERDTKVEPIKELKNNEISLSDKISKIREVVAFTVGNGDNEYFLFLNTSNKESQELLKKHTSAVPKNIKLNIIITNDIFDLDGAKKTIWILKGETEKERKERVDSVFRKNSTKYKWYFIFKNIFGGDKEMDKELRMLDKIPKLKKFIDINNLPALYDSNLIKRDISEIK